MTVVGSEKRGVESTQAIGGCEDRLQVDVHVLIIVIVVVIVIIILKLQQAHRVLFLDKGESEPGDHVQVKCTLICTACLH